jgi:SAM-dependent methyltransferase
MSETKSTHDEAFFQEYTSNDAILKYSKATAGYGISYLLNHDYKSVYLDALRHLPAEVRQKGISMLEFGCGAGMNVINLISMLQGEGIPVRRAIGTDFSPVLISTAQREAVNYLPADRKGVVEFFVARNETLINELVAAGQSKESLEGSFDLVLGVNTFRYCHRGGTQDDCARDVLRLLKPGGVCVNIDMSDRFPAFRSAVKNKFRQHKEEECYLPSLREYTAPFEKAGFEILRSEHFCWIPHSAGPFMCQVLRLLTPVFNTVARSRAMRSLVVARKPASASRA